MRLLDPYVFLCFLTVPPLNPNLVFCSTCLQRVSEPGYKETATDCEYLPTTNGSKGRCRKWRDRHTERQRTYVGTR